MDEVMSDTDQGTEPPRTHEKSGNARPQRLQKRLLLERWAVLEREWYVTHARLVMDLIASFGEEPILDCVEKTWWDLGYEAGLAWRERFENDPCTTMLDKARSWHDDPVFARGCCCTVPVLERDHWELVVFRCHKEVFLELDAPKTGLAWCMRDFATVQGWSPLVMMRQPTHLLRGDGYCHQIRRIVDDPSLQWEYSRETSERVGWRSLERSGKGEEHCDGPLEDDVGPVWHPSIDGGAPSGKGQHPDRGLPQGVEMPMQPAVFRPLPSRERLVTLVEEERRHNADITSYLWHVIPIANRFGDAAYDVAAESLAARGLPVTAQGLRELGRDLQTPAGRQRYAKQRRLHVMNHTTG